MLRADEMLEKRMVAAYEKDANDFLRELGALELSDEELGAVPSLFLPGWGEGYSSSVLKVAIAGKETMFWSNEFGDSLLADFNAFKQGIYSPVSSCKVFREKGPAEWVNNFWQYSAAALGRVFGQDKRGILTKDNPVLESLAWFNSHAIETIASKGVDKNHVSHEKMSEIQELADKHELSSFRKFIDVFRPHVIFYFYRDPHGVSCRNLTEEEGCEFVRSWPWMDDKGAIMEYQMGDTVILNMRHTTWMAKGNMKECDCASLIEQVLNARNLKGRLPSTKKQFFDVGSMSANTWRHWVSIIRDEAEVYPDMNNWDLSRHLMLAVARELGKTGSTMSAQTLVLLLNEVDKFRNDGWQYSPERRGPCSSVRGAYNSYLSNHKDEEAKTIAQAFRKLNGDFAFD